jgi:hypothetical protein
LDAWLEYREKLYTPIHFLDTDVFASQLSRLDNNTMMLACQIGFQNVINDFMDHYFNNSYAKDPATGLVAFYKFRDLFAAKPFIKNSQVFKDLNGRISELEASLYQDQYADQVNKFAALLKSNQISDKEKLQTGQNMYDKLYSEMSRNVCRTCSDSIFKVLTLYDNVDNNKLSVARTQLIINCTRYVDTLLACEGHIEANIRETSLNTDKKKELALEKVQIDKEASAINQEKNIFMLMPLQPKSEFRNEKSKVESKLNEAVKLIGETRKKT